MIATLAFGHTLACGQNQTTTTENQGAGTRTLPPMSTKDVVATVNGIPIRQADVRFVLNSGGHSTEAPARHRKNVLEVIIQRELASQRAIDLGLHDNLRYQEKLRRMEARINAFKRKELSELFWRELAGRAEVSEAEASRYFAEHEARIRAELHVWQILRRNEDSIRQALYDIEQGTPFEKVAGKQFRGFPKTDRAPWDLGYLRWKQVPAPWRDVVYDLKKSEVSRVIRGPKNRFWIIKLIDKRQNPDITFESINPTIIQVLKSAKIEELREKTHRDLRAKASIVYWNDPTEEHEE